MPAVLAHWAVGKDVAWRFINNKKSGYEFFQGASDDQHDKISRYVYFGANGPDLPYFYDADIGGKVAGTVGISKYADLFHYNKQGEFILQLVLVARSTSDTARKQRTMAYALGHTTHLAADSTIHPYVNCYAGAYHCQSIHDIHKISECHQDSWLAQKYFGRSHIDDGESWTKMLPGCYQVALPGVPGYTQVEAEAKEVLRDIDTAFQNTFGQSPGFEYLTDSYENYYDTAIDEGYDKAHSPIPRVPHESLVKHKELKGVDYCKKLVRKTAVAAAEKACEAVIALYQSSCSENDQNKFRSEVKNWNMDTGYWIDVTLEGNKLKIIWRHTWC